MSPLRAFLLVPVFALAASAQPTYAHDIAPIIQQKCQMCHRPGDVAPFQLLTYDDAVAVGPRIRASVGGGTMPPWKPMEGYGSFKGDFSLTDAQRQAVLDWVDAGMPMGDPGDLPPPLVSPGDWRLGQPDLIVSMPVAYTPVPAADHSHDRYRCFILPNVVDQDQWVRAVDILPGLRQIVHHVILYLTDDPTQIALAQQLDAQDSDPGYDCWGGPLITPGAGPGLIKAAGGVLGAWVPGANPGQLTSDVGILVPKGAYIIMQVHYNLAAETDGPLTDQTRVGLYYQPSTPRLRLLTLPLLNDWFTLQPNTNGQEADATFPIDLSAFGLDLPDSLAPKFSLIRVGPHMHTLGQQISSNILNADGTTTPLIQINNWDFHWQGLYDYTDPVPLPYRSTVQLSCIWNNTTDQVVKWGESTSDEMCLVYLGFTAEGPLASILFGNPN